MPSIREHRAAAYTGLAFFALAILATLLYPSEPDFVADPAAIAAFYEREHSELLASNVLYLVAAACLLWFGSCLAVALRRDEGEDRTLSTAAFAGTVAGGALILAASTADTTAALRADENGTIDPSVAAVMWDLQSALFGLAAPMAFAVTVFAVGLAALRTGTLPRWLGAVSVALAIALAIPPINYVSVIVFVFWVPIAGVSLALGQRTASAPEPLPARS